MTGRHSETAFETVIETHLLAHGYVRLDRDGFDRERAIFSDAVLDFIRVTQPAEWTKLEALHGAKTGELRELTDDHVPPRLLLGEPYPDNLITVPACESCNRGFQRDDEYTRDMVAPDFRAGRNATAATKVPKVFRSLQRPQSTRYRKYFEGQLHPTELVDSSGRPLSLRASPDRDRIENTGRHIMRGLHFHFEQRPLPGDANVYSYSKPGYDSIDFVVEHLTRLYEKAGARRDGAIGDGFSYAAASFGDAFIYLLLLYEYFWWIVVALPPHVTIPGLSEVEPSPGGGH